MNEAAPLTKREANALAGLVRQLGYDPQLVDAKLIRGERAKRAGLMTGLQLFAKDGRFLRMFSAREIKRRVRGW